VKTDYYTLQKSGFLLRSSISWLILLLYYKWIAAWFKVPFLSRVSTDKNRHLKDPETEKATEYRQSEKLSVLVKYFSAEMDFLRIYVSGHLISRFGDIPWPPRSPDLSAPEVLTMDTWKEDVSNQTKIH
jgi:hypothetical protein